MARGRGLWVCGIVAAFGCAGEVPLASSDARSLVLLHSSDLHSHVFPATFVAGDLDQSRGLGPSGERVVAGGMARLGTLLERARWAAENTLYLDSGDLWQGALIHELSAGEAELVGAAALGLDAQAVGNHDLDHGLEFLRQEYQRSALHPLLAANYVVLDGVTPIRPWLVLQAGALRVGVIGVGNVDSVQPLSAETHALGLEAQVTSEAVQSAIDALLPQCDLIVALTHLGVDRDRELVRLTSGLDVVLGGHQHVVLDEPVVERDCGLSDDRGRGHVVAAFGEHRSCAPRPVLIAHSGAYGRYLGQLALELAPSTAQGLEIVDHAFVLQPVTADVPEQPDVARALAPYLERLSRAEPAFARVPLALARAAQSGADSSLGNLVADAALAAAPADFALLPSSSLRTDLPAGDLDEQGLYEVLPFPDPLLRGWFSGRELAALARRIAEHARHWGCESPVQVAGAVLRLVCSDERPSELFVVPSDTACSADLDCAALGGVCGVSAARRICFGPAEPDALYALTTSRYLLETDTGADPFTEVVSDTLRGAVRDFVDTLAPCAGGTSAALPCVIGSEQGRIRFE